MVSIAWSEGRWFPTLVKGGAMGTVADRPVYACGVTHPWRETELAWWFDSVRNDWFPAPPIPAPRCYTSGCTTSAGLVVAGGRKARKDGLRVLNDVWLLSQAGNTWEWNQLPSMAQARGVAGLGAVGNKVLAVGGGDWERVLGGAFTADTVTAAEMLDLDNPGDGWGTIETPFSPRAGCAAVGIGGKVYVFGGYNCRIKDGARELEYYADTFVFDVASKTWKKLQPAPAAISGHCAVAWNDRYAILVGGLISQQLCGQHMVNTSVKLDEKRKILTGEYSDLVWVYDTLVDSFTLLGERTPHGLHDTRACVAGDTIFVVGGENVDPGTSNTTEHVMLGKITGD